MFHSRTSKVVTLKIFSKNNWYTKDPLFDIKIFTYVYDLTNNMVQCNIWGAHWVKTLNFESDCCLLIPTGHSTSLEDPTSRQGFQ